MRNNRRGQIMLLALMLMIFIFVVAVALMPSMREIIRNFRDENNCAWTNLSINEKALCLIVDMYLPYFIVTLLIGSASYLFYRMYTSA